MKKLVLFLALVSFTVVAFGQSRSESVDLEWGPEVKLKKSEFLADIVAKDENGFYVHKAGRGVFLQYFSNSLVLKKEKELELKQGKDRLDFEGFYNLKGNLYMFSAFRNNKQKKKYLFVQRINLKSLSPSGALTKVAEISYERKRNDGGFVFSVAPDSSTLLVRYDLPYQRGEAEKFGFHVFDKDMKELWTKPVTLPYDDELFAIYGTRVDRNGNAYVLGKRYKQKVRDVKKGKPNFDYLILRYSDKGNQKNEIPVTLKERFITDFTFRVRKNGELVCAGFYSDFSMSSIKGTFFMRIDGKTWKVKKSSTKDFPLDFLVQGLSERQEKKVRKKVSKGKDFELPQFDLDHLILRTDGGAVLLAEQFYITTRTYTSTDANGNTTTRTVTYYHYDDVLIVNIDPNGDIAWASKIEKNQMSSGGTSLLSYYVKVVGDKLYFIYNGNPREIYKTGADRRKSKVGKSLLVIVATVDGKGKVEKEPLFSIKDVKSVCIPRLSEGLNRTQTVLVCRRGKKQTLAKATFK